MKTIKYFCKIVLLSCLLFSVMLPAMAQDTTKKILPIVWIQPTLVTNENATRQLIDDGIKNAFASYKNVELLDFAESDKLFQNYLLENDITPDEGKMGNGFLPKKAYLADMAKEAHADYVFVINSRITDEKVKTAWLSFAGFKYQVTTMFNVYIYSASANKYIYSEKVSVVENAAGTSHFERAFDKCCKTFVKEHLVFPNLTF